MAKYKTKKSGGGSFKSIFMIATIAVIAGVVYVKYVMPKDNVETSTGEVINNETAVVEPINNPEKPAEVVENPAQNKILEEAIELKKNGELVKARELLDAAILNETLFSNNWNKMAAEISEINTKFITSDLRCPEKNFYTVKSGDVLVRIAYHNNTTVEQIYKNNPRLNPSRPIINPEQRLSVLSADWRLVAYKSKYKLLLYNGEKIFKIYDISIGKEGRTPIGTFLITDKVPEPNYRGIPYSGNGETGNELGTHWMRVEPTGDTSPDLLGYGIHGTWEPESIGKQMSNGCLRLLNDQVKELYELLPSKLKTVSVTIHD